MADIGDFKEQLESVQSSIESAGYSADQAADEAKAAYQSIDAALAVIGDLVDSVDSIMDYSKHDLEVAMRHLTVIGRLQAMYLNRLDNVVENNPIPDKVKFANFISFLEAITSWEGSQLVWDKEYKIESYYENSTYGYKTAKSEEV
jgi:ABC-type transporter Mla subunit MlaD